MPQHSFQMRYYVADIYEITENGENKKGPFELADWLRAHENDRKMYINLSDCTAMITDILNLDDKKNYIGCRIYKAREGSIPNKIKEQQDPTPVELTDDEKLGEMLCFIYDCEYKVIAMQKNIHSISLKQLSELFSRGLDDREAVNIEEIFDKVPLNSILSKKLKGFKVRFGNPKLLSSSNNLLSLTRGLADFESDSVTIQISAGRKKNKFLSNNLNDIIREIVMTKNPSAIKSAEVKVYNDLTGKTEPYDLLDNKLRDKIMYEESDKGEIDAREIFQNMLRMYNYKREKIAKILNPLR